MSIAALADLAGGNGWAFLSERDSVVREIREAVAKRAADEREREMKQFAVWVANAINGKSPT